MSLEYVKKRDGRTVPYQKDLIETAITKAYTATKGGVDEEKVQEIANKVEHTLTELFIEHIPEVEKIQDVVEQQIAHEGDFDVARAYILYREQQAEKREHEKEELLEAVERSDLRVVKRDGSTADFDIREIEVAVDHAVQGFEKEVETAEVIESIKLNVYDGIKTSEINQAIIMALKARVERDPAYSFVAARFLLNDLYKDVLGVDEFGGDYLGEYKKQFKNKIEYGIKVGRYAEEMADFDFEKLSAELKPERDRLFEYMGAQILHDRYFVRDEKQAHIEVPQYFWMRVAMGLSLREENKTEAAINAYNTLSQMLYVPSTPTLLHSGTGRPQMSSCYLNYVEDDLSHIFKVIGDNAQMSKWSGGIGGDWTNIRATNALVKTINTGSQGLIPFLKIVDATTASINRSGKRRGATAVYLETWHMDIEDFLDLRKNTGDDRRRTHDINTVNWVPDLFMKRVLEDKEWTLFSPEEVPGLHDLYGKAFEEKYVEYEKMADEGKISLWKRVPASKMWRKMITMLFETGHPWITFKDPSNIRSPQDHVGVVHNSNLCTEITLNTSRDETAVCNLGSINLIRHFRDGKLDKELMSKTVSEAMRMLDNVIDINFYPIQEAENSNLRHRPVGLGVMGYQDLLYAMKMSFDSEEAVKLSDEIMEFISYHAILNSSKLAKEKGAYSSYKGSKWDRGLFPVDTIELLEKERGESTGISAFGRMDWEPVREHVKEYGMRNSNTMAIAPTATIANISGALPSIEPIYKNLYVKSNFSGEFTVINRFLVRDLKKLDLWNGNMLDKLKYYDGSVQKISEVPEDLRNYYKEVFEIDTHWIIKHAAHRQKWIDQSQSVNIFTNSVSGKAISNVYFDAWKSGLKTTYYLRTLGATSIEKSTIDINKKYDDNPKDEAPKQDTPKTSGPKLHVYTEEICESCQ
jgi:ribonucleoside-diphosphate reductase alpha chain